VAAQSFADKIKEPSFEQLDSSKLVAFEL